MTAIVPLTVFAIIGGAATAQAEERPDQVVRGIATILEHQTEEVPGWPWTVETTRPAANIGGVVGLTLLSAYERSPDPATWVTLVQYSHSLRDAYAPEDVIPFKADIEFLARVAEAGLDESARSFASALFDRIQRISPTGADEHQRISDGRAKIPAVIGYDIALSIRAALAVGERRYAEQLADAALAADQLSLRDAEDTFEVTSVGALLHAIASLERADDGPSIQRAAQQLIGAQANGGSWAMDNTQATAYAVLGLASVESPRTAAAVSRGKRWLLGRQLRSGGWASYHDGLPEPFVGPVIPLAEAEALAAVLAL